MKERRCHLVKKGDMYIDVIIKSKGHSDVAKAIKVGADGNLDLQKLKEIVRNEELGKVLVISNKDSAEIWREAFKIAIGYFGEDDGDQVVDNKGIVGLIDQFELIEEDNGV